jgi:hypothetical protein
MLHSQPLSASVATAIHVQPRDNKKGSAQSILSYNVIFPGHVYNLVHKHDLGKTSTQMVKNGLHCELQWSKGHHQNSRLFLSRLYNCSGNQTITSLWTS